MRFGCLVIDLVVERAGLSIFNSFITTGRSLFGVGSLASFAEKSARRVKTTNERDRSKGERDGVTGAGALQHPLLAAALNGHLSSIATGATHAASFLRAYRSQ